MTIEENKEAHIPNPEFQQKKEWPEGMRFEDAKTTDTGVRRLIRPWQDDYSIYGGSFGDGQSW